MSSSKIEYPLVTIIVPVYKVEAYIRDCINSLVGQSYDNLEIILINDGSPDKCPAICDDYASHDKRVKVVHKKNGGVSSARNAGLDIAMGKFIVFVDSDDVVRKDYIETLHGIVLRTGASAVVCATLNGHKLTGWNGTKNDGAEVVAFSSADAITNMLYQKEIGNGPHAKFLKSNLLKKERFVESIAIAEDLELNCRIFQKIETVVYTPQELYFYRKREDSALNEAFHPKKMDEIHAVGMIIKDAQDKCELDVEAAAINRQFMAALFVAVQISGKQDRRYLNDCLSVVKKWRATVLTDKNSKIVYRVLAFSAIASPRVPVILMQLRTLIKVKFLGRVRLDG